MVAPSHEGPCCDCRFCASMIYHCCSLGVSEVGSVGDLELCARTRTNRWLGNVEHRRARHVAASEIRERQGNQVILNWSEKERKAMQEDR